MSGAEVWLKTSRGWIPRDRIESVGEHRGWCRVRLIGRRTLRPIYLINRYELRVLAAWLGTGSDFKRVVNPAASSVGDTQP